MFSINFWKFITIFYFFYLLYIELQNCSVNIKRVYNNILSYNIETIPDHTDPSLDSHRLQSLDSHHLHHRHYPRLNTAVTPVFSPPRQPPSSRSASVNGRNTMVIQQPPRRTIAASLPRPTATLSHPPLRSYTASTVTGSSSSSGHHANHQPTI
jgi:hypothetical protein